MFERRVLHHGPDPTAAPVLLSDRAVAGCWFELHRQGGCGAAEVMLRDAFSARGQIEIGDWISLEPQAGTRWYLGRVEQLTAHSPAGARLRLEGMGIELNEVFPGGFAADVDGVPPHRFGRTDLFSNDPDYAAETVDSANAAEDVVTLLLQRYVTAATHIEHDASLIEAAPDAATVASLKFRGEESVRSLVKELALAARGSSWGVNAAGKFFFLQQRSATLLVLRAGRDLTALEESRDREFLFNRVLLTGDYVYDVRGGSDWIARRAYRYRGNYVQPESRELHGERRLRMWIPWIRTAEDALTFVREFFRVYAQPTSRFLVETTGQAALVLPWEGRIRLEDRDGTELATARMETVRVQFDHVPRLRLELGPEDPRTLWPEPPEDERFELPEAQRAGGEVSVTDESSVSGITSEESSGSGDSSGSDTSLDSSDSEFSSSGGGSTEDSSDSSSDSSGLVSSEESSLDSSATSDSDGGSESLSLPTSGAVSSGAPSSGGGSLSTGSDVTLSSDATSDITDTSGLTSSGGLSSGGLPSSGFSSSSDGTSSGEDTTSSSDGSIDLTSSSSA